jgi:hypothetical protein
MNIALESARSLVAQIEAASAKCSESLSVVRANEGLGELEVYAKLVGLFLGHSYTNILAPIWERFPELEPDSFKEPIQERTPSLTPQSRTAIAEFLSLAVPALSEARRLLAEPQGEDALPFGGLPEVEHSVAEIDEFLRNPRFRDPTLEEPQ